MKSKALPRDTAVAIHQVLFAFGWFQQGVTTLTANLLRFHAARKALPWQARSVRPITLDASDARPTLATPPFSIEVEKLVEVVVADPSSRPANQHFRIFFRFLHFSGNLWE